MTAMGNMLPVAGQLFQGMAGYSAGRRNAAAYAVAAQNATETGVAEEARVRASVRAAIGDQIAGQWSNGMEGGTGSAIDAVRESMIQGAMDALTVRRDATMKAQSYEAQAANAKAEGANSLLSGLIGGAAKAWTAQQDWAVARAGTIAPGTAKAGMVGDGTNMTGAISRVGTY
ncbi:hypothetical protein [Novosphingobium sp. FKTRR1]|uniref:hypothetical protein n=1 Tax=Novosphingobium sp. FKTRR1 TaxID=2879118 RepID=UPI001CF06E6C|nr:hypothetical protein [Novosphingobium sp. FKTRR1]